MKRLVNCDNSEQKTIKKKIKSIEKHVKDCSEVTATSEAPLLCAESLSDETIKREGREFSSLYVHRLTKECAIDRR